MMLHRNLTFFLECVGTQSEYANIFMKLNLKGTESIRY